MLLWFGVETHRAQLFPHFTSCLEVLLPSLILSQNQPRKNLDTFQLI
jgi:hypothetical protein